MKKIIDLNKINDEAVYTIEEISDLLGVKIKTIYNYVSLGKIPVIGRGRYKYIRGLDLKEYLGFKSESQKKLEAYIESLGDAEKKEVLFKIYECYYFNEYEPIKPLFDGIIGMVLTPEKLTFYTGVFVAMIKSQKMSEELLKQLNEQGYIII